MDKEELKENVEKNTADEELNTQSKENDNADQTNEEKNLESEIKEVEKNNFLTLSYLPSLFYLSLIHI